MSCERTRSVVRRFAVCLAWPAAALLAVWLPGAVAAGQSMPAAGQPLVTRGAGLAYLGVRKPQRPQRSARDRHGLPAGRAGVDVAPRGFQGAWAARATDVGGLADVPSTVRAARRGHRDDRRRAGPEDRPRADECVHPDPHGQRSGAGCHDAAFVSGNPSISRTRSNTSWSKSTASTSAGRQGAGWRACSETQSSVFETARAIAIGRVVAREVAQWGVDR